MSKTHSTHEVNGQLVKVGRQFDPLHLDAGYHEQQWGEHSHPEHELLGDHEGVLVEHVEGTPVYAVREDGATVLTSGAVTHGPEFKLSWPNGRSVNVLCADVAREYLGSTK